MVVHWLTFQRPMKWVWIQSQVRELRFHLPRGGPPPKKRCKNIVTNSTKTLKMVHVKKIFLKNKYNSGLVYLVYHS